MAEKTAAFVAKNTKPDNASCLKQQQFAVPPAVMDSTLKMPQP